VLQVASFQVLLPKPKSACRKERWVTVLPFLCHFRFL
jgi:hypothetical protein